MRPPTNPDLTSMPTQFIAVAIQLALTHLRTAPPPMRLCHSCSLHVTLIHPSIHVCPSIHPLCPRASICSCIIDKEERTFTADNCQMLSNLAEMVVRELEKEVQLEEQRQRTEMLSQENVQLLRAIDAFRWVTPLVMLVGGRVCTRSECGVMSCDVHATLVHATLVH